MICIKIKSPITFHTVLWLVLKIHNNALSIPTKYKMKKSCIYTTQISSSSTCSSMWANLKMLLITSYDLCMWPLNVKPRKFRVQSFFFCSQVSDRNRTNNKNTGFRMTFLPSHSHATILTTSKLIVWKSSHLVIKRSRNRDVLSTATYNLIIQHSI